MCTKSIESVKVNSVAAKFENQTEDNYGKVTNPKFEMYKDKVGKFRLNARNGENILSSERYFTKAKCINSIESIRKNALYVPIVEE